MVYISSRDNILFGIKMFRVSIYNIFSSLQNEFSRLQEYGEIMDGEHGKTNVLNTVSMIRPVFQLISGSTGPKTVDINKYTVVEFIT